MFRHALAPLFEPRALAVIADRPLPVGDPWPAPAGVQVLTVRAVPGEVPNLPEALFAQRLDLVLLCVSPAVLAEVLRRLSPTPPRALIVLHHPDPDPFPNGTGVWCREWAAAHDCLLLGPGSIGLQRPHLGLNLSEYPTLARQGRVALVAQSRAIMASVLDWAEDVRLGFSLAISAGGHSAIEMARIVDYLATDPRTDSIAVYIEDVRSGRRLISALRTAAIVKPVVVLKSGRSPAEGGAEMVFDAALRRAGAVRVRYFVQLFSALKVLAYPRRPKGRRVAVLSNADAPVRLALDQAQTQASVVLAELAATTRRALGELLEASALADNPVISYAPWEGPTLRKALDVLVGDPGVDGVLVLLAPDAWTDMRAVSASLAQAVPQARKPVVTCFMGDASVRALRAVLDDAGVPSFRTPETAVDAFGLLATHDYNQQLLLQTRPPQVFEREPDMMLAQAALADIGASDTQRVASLLRAFRVPVAIQSMLWPVPPGPALRLTVQRDPVFGPVMRLGAAIAGQTLAQALNAAGLELLPLTPFLAQRLIERSDLADFGVTQALSPVAAEALKDTLVQISELLCELPEVESLAFDPLYVVGDALSVTDPVVSWAKQPVTQAARRSYHHMAIHPYPTHWVTEGPEIDGMRCTIRPIRPEDAQPLQDFVRGLSDESRYMRFVSMMRELTPRMLARYTQVDYDRELALVACIDVPNPAHRGHLHEVIIGLAHYLRNPDGQGAEYALVVADDYQRRGLGAMLMQALIEAAREQGLGYLEGIVLKANRPMLTLMQRLGMRSEPDPEEPSMRRLWMLLDDTVAG